MTTTQIDSGRFDFPNVAFYLGGTLALGACTWLLGDSWATYGPGWGLTLLVAYAAAFATGSWWLLRRGWRVPGGLLATLVVGLVPAIVFAFERTTGLWPDRSYESYSGFYLWISSSWFAMEVATIAAGVLALRWVRFPFLIAPIAFAAWFASMDAAEVVFGDDPSVEQRVAVSLVFGAVLIGVGTWVDRRPARPFAFWCHLFGLLSLQSALCAISVIHGSGGLAFTGMVGLGQIAVAVLLQRRTYLVFGGLGVFSWTCYLAHEVFSGTPLFPVALAAIGLAIGAGGVALERHRPATPVPDDRSGDDDDGGGAGYAVGTVGSR